jgi:hypothetical protein
MASLDCALSVRGGRLSSLPSMLSHFAFLPGPEQHPEQTYTLSPDPVNPSAVELRNGNLQIVNFISLAPNTGPTNPPLQVDSVVVYDSVAADRLSIFTVRTYGKIPPLACHIFNGGPY